MAGKLAVLSTEGYFVLRDGQGSPPVCELNTFAWLKQNSLTLFRGSLIHSLYLVFVVRSSDCASQRIRNVV